MTQHNSAGAAITRAPASGPLDEIDLTGVDPLRREEVRRRIAVVRGYIALGVPTDADRRSHAQRLNLSVNQFMALVRAWRDQPRPGSVAGSGYERGVRRRGGPKQLAPDVKAATEEGLANLEPGATLSAAVIVVAEACEQAGCEAPSQATIWKMLMEQRVGQFAPDMEGVLIIGVCWVRLPMKDPVGIVMPQLTMAVRAVDGHILGATLSKDPVRRSLVAMLGASSPNLKDIRVDEGLAAAVTARSGIEVTVSPGSMVRRQLTRVVGIRIGSLRLVLNGRGRGDAAHLLRSRKDSPLTPADASAVIRGAIDKHNLRCGGEAVVWID